ncbi:MAG TPA: type II toxin-antitoxin system prevent-host-death family antitoxin [Thermoanaerobaculia bacterium]
MTKVVAADQAELSEIVDGLKPDDEVVITRDGKPVARLVPIASQPQPMTRAEIRDAVLFIGDVETPVDEWDVERDRR